MEHNVKFNLPNGEQVTFKREFGTSELFHEMVPLLEKHWHEIAHFKDIPMEPDWVKYEELEKMNALRMYIVRDEMEKMIGYAVFFLQSNPHYRSSFQALQDVIYISPDKRGFGMQFIDWCDGQLKDEGVQVVYHHVKNAHNFGAMLERLSYKLVDLIYARRLD